MPQKPSFKPYNLPSGGWGSARSLGNILRREGVLLSGTLALTRQNKVDGFQCVSCAWTKPAAPLPFEFCENGAKATAWEITTHRCTPDFFARHTVTELLDWDDYSLEQAGRLTHPMRYDAATDRYLPVSPGTTPSPRSAAKCARSKTARASSSTAPAVARTKPATSMVCWPGSTATTTCPTARTCVTRPHRWRCRKASVSRSAPSPWMISHATDCIMFFGQNAGSNSPRMLHALQHASERGVPIIVYNPLRERGLESFINPQSPTEMLSGSQPASPHNINRSRPAATSRH